MLNVDGMNGIVSINRVVQWLYMLTGSSVRQCCHLIVLVIIITSITNGQSPIIHTLDQILKVWEWIQVPVLGVCLLCTVSMHILNAPPYVWCRCHHNTIIIVIETLTIITFFSKSPLVSRTALRLLIVFVSYSECNSFLFIQAVSSASLSKGAFKAL